LGLVGLSVVKFGHVHCT